MGSLNQRRGIIIGTTEEGGFARVEAEVPLAEMFGYSTVLRSLHPGQGRVHHGVRPLPPGAEEPDRRSHQGLRTEEELGLNPPSCRPGPELLA